MLKIYDFKINNGFIFDLVDITNLNFSWKIKSDKFGVFQNSYCLKIFDDKKQVFDSGFIESEESVGIVFDGLKLQEDKNYQIELSVKDSSNCKADIKRQVYTAPDKNFFNGAKWIRPKKYIDGWSPFIRTKFSCENVKKVKIYTSGLGASKYYLNGESIEDYYLDPPMTNYEDKIFYRCFDVTKQIKQGGNCFCAMLGEGFYAQDRAWKFYDSVRYGKECLICKIVIEENDGSVKTVVTNTTDWKYKYSAITLNNVYGGEIYDARLETEGFSAFDCSDDEWGSVTEDETVKPALLPCNIPPIRIIKEIKAKSVTPCSGVKDGAWIIDIGENISGIVKLTLPETPAGATVVLRYAETLNGFYPDYRSTGVYANQMLQQDIYIAKGDKNGETYTSSFTFHGFRYIEVTGVHDLSEGYGTVPKKEIITAYQISTDFNRKSYFNCSNAYLNKLIDCMHSTYRSSYIGYPVDNPTRERCGWLCDAHAITRFGLFNYENVDCYEKYLDDVTSSKDIYGKFTNIAPGKRTNHQAFPEFGCGIIYISYYLNKYCGDKKILSEKFPVMEKWIEYELSVANDHIIDNGLGDWDNASGNEDKHVMPKNHLETFMFYECCVYLTEICKILKNGKDRYYNDLCIKIKDTILAKLFDKENKTYGYIGSNGMALCLGLYNEGDKPFIVKSLVDEIKANKYRIVTGMPSLMYLITALCENGLTDLAFKYLFNDHKQSYKYMIDEGATSVWEMISQGKAPSRKTYVLTYNQPMHGMFLYFVYSHLAGIKPKTDGYKEFYFDPCETKYVEKFDCSLGTSYGDIKVKKSKDGYRLTVPTNTKAFVEKSERKIFVNGTETEETIELVSGRYNIVIK